MKNITIKSIVGTITNPLLIVVTLDLLFWVAIVKIITKRI